MTKDVRTRLTLRLPKKTDERLSNLSMTIGVSKNAYILYLIAEALGMEDEKKETAS